MPESLFNKVAVLRPANLLKNRLWYRYFPVNFAKFLRTPSFTEHLRWLLRLCLNSLAAIKNVLRNMCGFNPLMHNVPKWSDTL